MKTSNIHPFVATPNKGMCSSCGLPSRNSIHNYQEELIGDCLSREEIAELKASPNYVGSEAWLQEQKENEKFLMAQLPNGVRGFISLSELDDERLVGFLNDVVERGVQRFAKVGAKELCEMEAIQ